MNDQICMILKEFGIDLCAPVPMSNCTVIRMHKLLNCGFDSDLSSLTAYMLAAPYLTPSNNRNISAYAAPRDYHKYFDDLFNTVIPVLKSAFPSYKFAGFADNSPINERDAAAMSGLGIIGDNGLLITEKYSSFVFLGEIITDMPITNAKALPIKRCISCGECKKGCPLNEQGVCLSSLTQKKGELCENEQNIIRKYGSAWGCDICQLRCPYTAKAIQSGSIYTNIDYFKEAVIPFLTEDSIQSMSDSEFADRAYSWRKRETILRNLKILNKLN